MIQSILICNCLSVIFIFSFLRKRYTFFWRSMLFISLLCVTMIVASISNHANFVYDTIKITATNNNYSGTDDPSVLLTGYCIDGTKYDISSKNILHSGWHFYNEGNDYVYGYAPRYSEKQERSIEIKIPVGREREIFFNGSDYRGEVEVEQNKIKSTIDTSDKNGNDVVCAIAESDPQNIFLDIIYRKILFYCLYLFISILVFLLFFHNKSTIESNVNIFDNNKTQEKLTWIDGLKGMAIIGTILVHVSDPIRDELSPFLQSFTSNGARGVQLFFIISGFLSFRSLKKEKNQICSRHKYKKYIIKKYVRLWPLYIIALGSLMLIQNTWHPIKNYFQSGVDITGLVSQMLLLHGLHPWYLKSMPFYSGWYIGTLMLFYFIAPFLAKKINSIYDAIKFYIISLSGGLIITHIIESECTTLLLGIKNDAQAIGGFFFCWLPTQLPCLALGIILYYLANDNNMKTFFSKKRRMADLMILIFGCIFTILTIINSNNGAMIHLYSISFFCLIVSQIINPSKIFQNRALCQIGRHSYGILVFHTVIMELSERFSFINTFDINITLLLRLVVLLFFSLLCSIVADYFVNRPIKILSQKE